MAKKKNEFSGQSEEEIIIKVMNRHPFTFIRDAIIYLLIFVVSLTIMVMFFFVPYILPIAFVFFVFSIIGGFYTFFTWERDKFVITDQRIVDIEQKTLFIKRQKEAFLGKIQDVSFETNGFWGSLFNYGNVNIQTASDTSLNLNDVYRPELVQKIVLDLIKEEDVESEDDNLMEKMTEMIRRAIREEKKGKKK